MGTGVQGASALKGVLEAALYVDDLDRAKAFYGDMLGLEQISQREGRDVFFRCGATMVLIFRAEETRKPALAGALPIPVHGATGAGHICFAVEGALLDALRQRLEAAGVQIEADFRWSSGARSVYVRDPDGNSVEFAEPRLWAAP